MTEPAPETAPGTRPLDGVLVLDAATWIAAPVSAAILAEFGAEVIKIEKPGAGDPLRGFGTAGGRGDGTLNWLNEGRNKRSITLDLAKPEGAALFRRLAAGADVVCENFRTGTMERWGLGWDALLAVCEAHEVPIAPILSIPEIYAEPHYAARGNFVRLEDGEGGEVVLPAPVPRLSITPGRLTSPGPRLGEANDEVYRGRLGLSAAELKALAAAGVI